ncbi:MAG TPA: hypothetical protein VKR53_15340, partial [Puia sp.]|nr:hypothetical protein [Puia sp.]
MKKFYSIVTAMILLFCLGSKPLSAQIVGLNLTPGNGTTWSGDVGAGATCTGCTITLSGNNTFTFDQTLTLINSTIKVTNNSRLIIATTLTLQNTHIIVGDINSTASTANIFINSGAAIRVSDASSYVRLGNVNNYISGGTANPAGQIQSPTTITIFGFTFTVNTAFYTATGSSAASPYNLNCGGANPNSCKNGFVYGPVISSQKSAGGFVTYTTLGVDSPLPVVLGSFSASLTA